MLLLGHSLTDLQGSAHAMAGLLPFQAAKDRLQVGYRQLTVSADSLLLRRGERWMGHEFHRWHLQPLAGDPAVGNGERLWQVEGWRTERREEGWNRTNVHASWIHLHWGGSWTIPCRWRAALETAAKATAF